MFSFLSWIFVILVSTNISGSTISDLVQHVQNATPSDEAWISDASGSEHNQFIGSFSELEPKREIAKYFIRSRLASPIYRHPHLIDLDSLPRRRQSYYPIEGRQDYRASALQDQQAMHSLIDYDVTPFRKHDFVGGQNGGWDMFQGGGSGIGHGGSGLGLGLGAGLVKKGKEAKALFFLMAPLIILAVFGPILATQAMMPWVAASGGLTSVSTVAGKRKKRSNYDPRQIAELEKRLRLFLEVQNFIARTGSFDFVEEMGEAFLRCQKYNERRNKCLERIACEYTDETSVMDSAERRIAKMVLENVMSNPMIPASIKGRLSKGSTFGRNHRGHCRSYWCEAIDGSKVKS